jgi:two-component system cell cycle sensor histidine kinase/response regulator CckA
MSVEARYRALIEHSQQVICLLERDGRGTWVSPWVTDALGYGVDDFLALGVATLVHPDDQPAFQAALARVAEHATTPVVLRHRLRHKNGRWRWMEGSFSNRLAHPALAAIVLNLSDITERQLLEERIQSAQKMDAIGRLAGGIAHDFNNMLSAITGFTNLTINRLPPGDVLRDDLREVLDAAARATLLTKQLLAFSRQQILQPRVFDLAEQVRRMDPMLRRALGEDIELAVEAAAPTLVKADVAQVEQVLLNLAINARDAMPRGGKLGIRVSTAERDEVDVRDFPEARPGRHASLTVADSGPGMASDVRERIFEPFFTTKPGMSSGLGLSTVFGIVTQSHGHLAVQSAPGAGTIFEVFLPLSAEEAAPVEKPISTGTGAGHETILLVEDEAAVRRYAGRVLRAAGYRVIEASSGKEALTLAAAHTGTIDLLFTDVVMPGMSGPQLADKLGALRPGLRVLYTSGYAATVIERHGVLDEKFELIEKPIAPQELVSKVREMLDRARATA